MSEFRFIGFTGIHENVCFCERCRDEADARERVANTGNVDLMEQYMRRGMLLCYKCRNKRCPRAEWCGYVCSGSNALDQVPVTVEESGIE